MYSTEISPGWWHRIITFSQMMVIAYEVFVKCSKIGTPSANKPVVYGAFVILYL